MQKLLLVFLLAALTSYASASAMTADEVIAKHLEAVGGEKTIRDTETLFLKGTAFMQGTPLQMKMWVKLPNMSYSEISMNNMVMGNSGCDGENAWLSQMGQTYYLEGEMKQAAFRQADMFPLLDLEKRGRTATYAGEATVKGDKAHKVEVVYPEGDTVVYFFDAETFYLVKEDSKGSSESNSSFKEFDGTMWPTKVTVTSAQGQQMITFDSVAINPDVADSLFVMPEDAQPIPGMHKAPADSTKPAEPEK
jgi:outer membrane lipoprotein-sorting protein